MRTAAITSAKDIGLPIITWLPVADARGLEEASRPDSFKTLSVIAPSLDMVGLTTFQPTFAAEVKAEFAAAMEASIMFPVSTDILIDLKAWRDDLVTAAPHRKQQGEFPEIEIDLLNRAIAEIERLRAGR